MNRYEKLSEIFKKYHDDDAFEDNDFYCEVAELIRETANEEYNKGADMAKSIYRYDPVAEINNIINETFPKDKP